MRKLSTAIILCGVAIVAWNLAAPIEYTVPARLGNLLGAFEANWTKAREDAVASQTEALAEANAQVQRRNLMTQRAVEAEAEIARNQISGLRSTHFLKSIIANVSDGVCVLSLLGQAQGDASSKKYEEACSYGDQVRRSMADDYADAINDARTRVMSDMNQSFDDAQQGSK